MTVERRGTWSAGALAMAGGALVGCLLSGGTALRPWLSDDSRLVLSTVCGVLAQTSFFVAGIGIAVERRRDRAILALVISVTAIVLQAPLP